MTDTQNTTENAVAIVTNVEDVFAMDVTQAIEKIRADVRSRNMFREGTVIRFRAVTRYDKGYWFAAVYTNRQFYITGADKGMFGTNSFSYQEFVDKVLLDERVCDVEIAENWKSIS